jgi:hypothetical protein
MIYRSDLEAALWVTPAGVHMRIGPKRASSSPSTTASSRSCRPRPSFEDPLKFSDGKPYKDRLAAARKATGEQDAMAIGYGKVGGADAVVLVQDFAFMGGSLGMAAGEGFIAAAEAASKRQVPLIASSPPRAARGCRKGPVADADGAHHPGHQRAEGRGPALRRGADRPDHRRRHRLLRHAGRRPPGRAGRPDRLRRSARHRADHPRDPAAGLPALGIPGRTRHGRPWSPRARSCRPCAGLDPEAP